MRRMTKTVVTTPHATNGHISFSIISHLGADSRADPEALPVLVVWATTETGTGPHGQIIAPKGQPQQVLFWDATWRHFRSSNGMMGLGRARILGSTEVHPLL